jgi:DNA repair protein RadC
MEQFLSGGADEFTDEELLELLLSYAVPAYRDVRTIAQRLMAEFGTLPRVLAAPVDELVRIKGVKSVSATLLKLVERLRTQPVPTATAKTATTKVKPTQSVLFDLPNVPAEPTSQPASSDRHSALRRGRSGKALFAKAILREAIALLPGIPDTDSLDKVRQYLQDHLHVSARQTRERYALYIILRMFPDGHADRSLRLFTRRYAGTRELAEVCFYRFIKVERLMEQVMSDLLLPAIGVGWVARADLLNYLTRRFPGTDYVRDCTGAIVEALNSAGIANADRKGISFAYQDIPPAAFAFVLHSEYPTPGMYGIEALERNSTMRAMLWNPDGILPALYDLRNRKLISKVSEIDSVRQFTTSYTLAEVVDRLVKTKGGA